MQNFGKSTFMQIMIRNAFLRIDAKKMIVYYHEIYNMQKYAFTYLEKLKIYVRRIKISWESCKV